MLLQIAPTTIQNLVVEKMPIEHVVINIDNLLLFAVELFSSCWTAVVPERLLLPFINNVVLLLSVGKCCWILLLPVVNFGLQLLLNVTPRGC